jgi:HSP20 family protein
MKEEVSQGVWLPPVDILERGNEVVLKIDLPGLSQNEIEVRVEENTLIVQGERRFIKEALDENYIQMERPYGTFRRVFNIPRAIDQENVKASSKDGVLRVILPKRQGAQLKQVLVESK